MIITDTAEFYYNITHNSSVCILLNENDEIVFERRSIKIPDQPGDVCLPGGMIEEGESPVDAAIREACEELLVSPNQIEIKAELSPFLTGNLLIHPYTGIISGYAGTFNPDECSETFTVPLEFFKSTNPVSFPVKLTVSENESFPYDRIQGGRNYKWRSRTENEYFYDFNGITIWGITAKIIRAWIMGTRN